MSDIVNEAIVLTNAKARRHATQVKLDFKSDGQILCDEIEIEQVMVNLINNAIDAIQTLNDRWVTIQIEENQKNIYLRVRDSGPRISSEIEMRLFEPFFTTKPIGKGTGLGLSITKGILDEHYATIEVVAGDNHSCFEICFAKVAAVKNET